MPSILTTLVGTPTTVTLEGTSFNTTAFAPIFTLSPIVISQRSLAPQPIKTLLPTVGCRFFLEDGVPLPPRVTP